MRAVVLSIMLIVLAPALVAAQSQMEMTAEACRGMKAADAALNATWAAIVKRLRDEPKTFARLKTAQKAWLAFRDAHLTALYEPDDPALAGTARGMCECLEQEVLTRRRVEQLKTWAEGVEEGDVCVGNRPVR